MKRCALLLGLAVGCSWVHLESVPDAWHPAEPLDCTGSKGWPTIDALSAGIYGLGALVGTGFLLASKLDENSAVPGWTWAPTVGSATFAVIAGYAAHDGFASVRACRDARERQRGYWAETPRHEHEAERAPALPAPASQPLVEPTSLPVSEVSL